MSVRRVVPGRLILSMWPHNARDFALCAQLQHTCPRVRCLRLPACVPPCLQCLVRLSKGEQGRGQLARTLLMDPEELKKLNVFQNAWTTSLVRAAQLPGGVSPSHSPGKHAAPRVASPALRGCSLTPCSRGILPCGTTA